MSAILTTQATEQVEAYLYRQFKDVEKYSNRSLLDESGIYDLYQLAATIYASGFEDGQRIQARLDAGRRIREREGS